MQQQQSWQSTVIALGFIAFAGRALAPRTTTSAPFGRAVGTIVGVLTGAIPSYFFKQQSDKATATAVTDPTAYKTLMTDHPELA